MIEVLFGESEAASMKAAKNTIVIRGKTEGPVSVWLAGKKKASEKGTVRWIEGTPEEVICLGFMLDMGDIQEEIDSPYRKNLIDSMYAQEPRGKDPESDQESRKLSEVYAGELRRLIDYLEKGETIRIWYSDAPYSVCGFYQLCSILSSRKLSEVYAGELRRLIDYLEKGETIRIWYSDAPYSVCGFYQLCSILSGYEGRIRVVKLPQHIIHGKVIVSYKNWAEVAAEEFAGFLQYEKDLTREEIRMYRCLWYELREDNSPLRAVMNGRVIGVGEDFYDFLIWKMLTEEPVKEARLIGDILGYYPVNVSDWWYGKRIDHFIEQGKISIVKDSEKKYGRILSYALTDSRRDRLDKGRETMGKTGIKPIVIEEICDFARKYNVKKVILFGSRARGDFKEKSDIDLAVQGGDFIRFMLDVNEETSTLLSFDIINLDEEIQSELRESIEKEGKIVYEEV